MIFTKTERIGRTKNCSLFHFKMWSSLIIVIAELNFWLISFQKTIFNKFEKNIWSSKKHLIYISS